MESVLLSVQALLGFGGALPTGSSSSSAPALPTQTFWSVAQSPSFLKFRYELALYVTSLFILDLSVDGKLLDWLRWCGMVEAGVSKQYSQVTQAWLDGWRVAEVKPPGWLFPLADENDGVSDDDGYGNVPRGLVGIAFAQNHGRRSSIRAVGVMELITLETKFIRFALTDIAHIDSIIQGSTHETSTRVLKTQELVSSSEQETSTETTEEQGSTESESLESEVSKQLDNETTRNFGKNSSLDNTLTVSGGVGVKFSNSTKIAMQMNAGVNQKESRTAAQRETSKLAKEVVNKAISVVKKRTLKKAQETLREETETLDRRLLQSQPDQHTIAVYRFMEKVQMVQPMSHGRRMMLEAFVYDPAAPLVSAHALGGETNVLPAPPTRVKRAAAQFYAMRYGLEASALPPPAVVWKEFAFGEKAEGKSFVTTHQIEVPEGYGLRAWTVIAWYNPTARSGASFDLGIGTQRYDPTGKGGNGRTWGPVETNLRQKRPGAPLPTGQIPVTVHGKGMDSWSVAITAEFEFVEEGAWEVSFVRALREAHAQRASEAMVSRSSADLTAGLASPGTTKEVIRNRMKLASIQMLHPNFRHHAVFFEKAIDWSRMEYSFMPSFWGNAETQAREFEDSSPDPHYNAFLRAGAARVMIPVYPGYESAVLYLLETGQVWEAHPDPDEKNDIPEPALADHRDVLQEVREFMNHGADGAKEVATSQDVDKGEPFGAPFEARVPIKQVMLQPVEMNMAMLKQTTDS